MSTNSNTSLNMETLPYDVSKVFINNKNVTVILKNGSKGIAQCSKDDTFDAYIGFCLAYYKAHNSKNYELKKSLKGCIEYADKKGYKQAILNNDR
jgi:hypothetical protein